jgi:hypothetical protein
MSGKGAAIAADALWNSGTKADATAVGIDGDGGATEVLLVTGHIGSDGVQVVVDNSKTAASGADTIVNTQQIDVAANATAPSVGVAIEAKKGLAATVTNVTTDAPPQRSAVATATIRSPTTAPSRRRPTRCRSRGTSPWRKRV